MTVLVATALYNSLYWQQTHTVFPHDCGTQKQQRSLRHTPG